MPARDLFDADDGQRHEIAVQKLEASIDTRVLDGGQMLGERRRARHGRCHTLRRSARSSAAQTVMVHQRRARLARCAADHAYDTIGLVFGQRRDGAKAREQVHEAAGDVVRARAPDNVAPADRAVAEQVAAQERRAQLFGYIEDQIRNAFGVRFRAGESEQLLPGERRDPMHQLQLRAAGRRAVPLRRDAKHALHPLRHLICEAAVARADRQTDAVAGRA